MRQDGCTPAVQDTVLLSWQDLTSEHSDRRPDGARPTAVITVSIKQKRNRIWGSQRQAESASRDPELASAMIGSL